MLPRQPDFENLRRTLLRQGHAPRVPLLEFGIDHDIKNAFLGRPVETLQDEVDFWYEAGYDHVPIQVGLRTMFWPGYSVCEKAVDRDAQTGPELFRKSHTHYTLYREGDRDMNWAQEGKGVITTLEDFHRFPWPDPERMDLSALEDIRPLLPPGMKVIAVMGYVFTSCWWLMGMETFCVALFEQPELVRRMYDRIWRIQSRVLERVLACDVVGAIHHPDDMAYADGMIVSPKHLRESVFPWYRWCGGLVRDHNLPYIFHSDGRLYPILEDILACGFNALNPIEPKAMDIVDLKRRFGDRLCLIGNIDLGYTLTRGTPEEVDAEVRERIRVVGEGGGYCVASSNSVTAYVPLANFNAMREAAFKYGSRSA